ncbi:PREDICTED: alpha-1-acid glycoprotein-like [Acanthisitta chloris]|uniref:alpha-1-acid glycoprotein-like n=1 Tax=Acanthisitta chloris TaxID=57068 RepID=UPI0004F0CBE6|nr:PREDICTED: alpha-1-acid glycoprotein-like [Acanthisitta chloris]
MAMARVGIILSLSLVALLPADASPCGPLRPDGTTASKMLGTWLYVAGAAQFPQHRLEMLLIDHAYLNVDPLEQQLLITHRVAAGNQCHFNNLTHLEIEPGNMALVKDAKTQKIQGMLMNLSSEDLLLVQYQMERERTYLGQYLYARNLSISPADKEEFEHHVECLGLRKEQIVYAPWRTDLCQMKDEKGSSPRTEPTAAVTASPPPGSPQPGSSGN